MARYRKIDPRIWGDEKFAQFGVLERLGWFVLLTHPIMTPMGAGVMPPGLFWECIGGAGDWCPLCEETCGEHSGEGILEGYREGSLILRDSGLVILPNYLLYNTPANPNELAGWIGSCEELPRSSAFVTLRDHLSHVGKLPEWMFLGLLNPLAEQKNRGLREQFYNRVGNHTRRVSSNHHRRVAVDSTGNPKQDRPGTTPTITGGTQEQEQEQDITTKPSASGPFLDNSQLPVEAEGPKDQDRKKDQVEYPDWLDLDRWKNFKEHRTRIKKPMTKQAERLNLTRLAKMRERGYASNEVIDEVIERGWQGFSLGYAWHCKPRATQKLPHDAFTDEIG